MDESRSAAAFNRLPSTLISVVTVHGLWMHRASMGALRRRLEAQGFRVSAFGYPSVTGSLDANAAALASFLQGVPGETVHLVGHSLGGAVVRTMLERALPAPIGRVVCLGSPLRGSLSAQRLARWPGGSWLVGKSLAELGARGGFTTWPERVEAGAIAGSLPFGAGRLLGPFGAANDGTVAVAETLVEGLRDHVVLPVSHVALLWSASVAEQVQHFLAHGRFKRGTAP